MDDNKYGYVNAGDLGSEIKEWRDTTGTCFTQVADATDPDSLAALLDNYILTYVNESVLDLVAEGPVLASRMEADQDFIKRVEAGWKDIDEGRVSSIEDVKRRLGDL